MDNRTETITDQNESTVEFEDLSDDILADVVGGSSFALTHRKLGGLNIT